MARNPYTQDITKSSIYKKVTGQEDKPLFDQALEFAAEIKNFGSDKVEENMQILRDEKIFDIQNSKRSFSALSKPIFAIKHALEIAWRDLRNPEPSRDLSFQDCCTNAPHFR